MKISKLMRQANPVQEDGLSVEGRAALRSITGVVETPAIETAQPKAKWKPVAAVGGVTAALVAGFALLPVGGSGTMAFADEVDATVVQAEANPGDWGTSALLEFPLPEIDGQKAYWEIKLWQQVGGTVAPDTVKFNKIESGTDTALYRSEDFGMGELEVSLYGPKSDFCSAGDPFEPGAAISTSSEASSAIGVFFCEPGTDYQFYTNENRLGSTTMGTAEGTIFTVDGITTDPQALAADLSALELDADGNWAVNPNHPELQPPAQADSFADGTTTDTEGVVIGEGEISISADGAEVITSGPGDDPVIVVAEDSAVNVAPTEE
jgi:uncharacterized cupin superfamily protein